MNYEIVNLEEKKIVGLTARTNNSAPDMGMVIGGLWNDLYQKGVYQNIKDKANKKAVGLYSDYESDMAGDYDVTIGCEVNSTDNIPESTAVKVIPSGKYAKKFKELYLPKTVPAEVKMPSIKYIMIDGKGNPNDEDGEYSKAVSKIDNFIKENGLQNDIGIGRKHHEIYLSDPRKCNRTKMKIVLRIPIKKI